MIKTLAFGRCRSRFICIRKVVSTYHRKVTVEMKDDGWTFLDWQALSVIRLTLSRNVSFNTAKEKITTRWLFMLSGGLVAQHLNELNIVPTQFSSVRIEFDYEVQELILLSFLLESWNATVMAMSSSTRSNKLKFHNVHDLILSEEIWRRVEWIFKPFNITYKVKRKKFN